MARLIAIDYGTKRTGLAVTDPLGIIASPLETVDTKQLERYLADYFQREEVSTIVVGHPRQMNGQPSETMRFIEPLIGRLRHAYPEKKVVADDERCTSVLAQRTIRESGIGKMARRDKSLVDKVSAAIILQDYMASNNGLM